MHQCRTKKTFIKVTDDSNRHQETYVAKIAQNNSDLVGEKIVKFAEKSYHNLLKTPKIC